MPRCLVVDGHPLSPSFSGAVSDHFAQTMQRPGLEVRQIRLSALEIPELATRKPGDGEMTGDVLQFWDALAWADHVVIVHPLWWGGMPGKLKALFDIALQSGKAYRYQRRNPLPLGLLRGRSARLIVTSDTPAWFMVLGYGNAHMRAVKNQILRFIGLDPVWVTHLSVMRGSSAQQRTTMLGKVAKASESDALRLLKQTRAKPYTPQPA